MTHDNKNTSSLTLDALLAAAAARTPAEQERDLAYADAAALGLHAQELADHHLANGDLANARRWYQVAVHYDLPGAADALNDVETLIEVTTTIETNTETTAEVHEHHDASADSDAQIAILDDLSAAAALVRQAHEHAAHLERRAQAILDDARHEADRIVASAHQKAESATEDACTAHDASLLTKLLTEQDHQISEACGHVFQTWTRDDILLLGNRRRVLNYLAGHSDLDDAANRAHALLEQPMLPGTYRANLARALDLARFVSQLDTAVGQDHKFARMYMDTNHYTALVALAEGIASGAQDNVTRRSRTARNVFLDAFRAAYRRGDPPTVLDGLPEALHDPTSGRQTLWTPASSTAQVTDIMEVLAPRETIRVGPVAGAALQELRTRASAQAEEPVSQPT